MISPPGEEMVGRVDDSKVVDEITLIQDSFLKGRVSLFHESFRLFDSGSRCFGDAYRRLKARIDPPAARKQYVERRHLRLRQGLHELEELVLREVARQADLKLSRELRIIIFGILCQVAIFIENIRLLLARHRNAGPSLWIKVPGFALVTTKRRLFLWALSDPTRATRTKNGESENEKKKKGVESFGR
jgi:hypothetical protein